MKKKLPVLLMRITLHMCMIGILFYVGSGVVWAIHSDAQIMKDTRITLVKNSDTLAGIFRTIERQSKFKFVFEGKLDTSQRIEIALLESNLEHVLQEVGQKAQLNFKQIGETITVKQLVRLASSEPVATSAMREVVVTGRVTDAASNESLPGATVIVKNTARGTSTDIDGRYSITVNAGEVLQFSFIGYNVQEVVVGNQSVINVALTLDSRSLDEVVVVGYGTQSKKDITSAIGSLSVGDKKLADLPLTGPEQLLQGRVSGVNVTQNSGTPGGRSTVRIRGASSITGGNDPLYVVDGIPINTGNYSGAAAGSVQQNPLANISPNDIASIEVLKDASAAAIYGSRASNGVIIITTKRGAAESTRISYNMYYGFQEVAKRIPLLDGPEWGELINEANRNVGRSQPIADPSALPTTDWQDEIFRSSPIQNHELSLSGGTQRSQYFLSGSYLDQQGVVIGSGFSRGNFRFNFDQHINERLKAGVSLSLNRSKTDRVSTSDRQGIVAVAIVKSPAVPARLPDGSLNPNDPYISNIDNPLLIADQVTNEAFNNRVLGNTYIDYEIIEGLTLRSTFGVDYLSLEEIYFVPPNNLTVVGRTTNGTGTNSHTQDIGWINENTLNFAREIGSDHRISALLGYSNQESVFSRTIAAGSNFALESIPTLGSASIKNSSSTGSSWGLVSYFSRFNYGYKDKFNFAASYRVDGSSRFSENNKYGTFPSVSASYRLGQEAFLQDKSWVEDLKFRASWGRTGNQEIGNFTSRGLSGGGFNYIGQSGLAPTQLANPELTWETTEQTNLGVDFSLLKNRVNLTVDAYLKKTSGLLLEVLLPRTSGFVSSLQNVGNVENRGVEVLLNTVNVDRNDFRWTSDFNIAFNRNKVTNLPGGPRPLGFNGYASIVKEGYPLGTFYGWKILGVNPETGDYIFDDLNGDNNIPFASTTEDVQVIGSAQPKFIGGLTNSFVFKNFDASVFLHFVYGNEIFNQAEYSYGRLHTWFNSSTLARERWRQPGDIATLHRAAWGDPYRNGSVSDRVLQDGSFLRIKNISLGYNMQGEVLRKLGVSNLRIYLAGQNLLTFTQYRGYDPEVNAYEDDSRLGFDLSSYPQARSYTMGLNLTF
jgi:TonB-linked SusC/RagA family outer membrane protein